MNSLIAEYNHYRTNLFGTDNSKQAPSGVQFMLRGKLSELLRDKPETEVREFQNHAESNGYLHVERDAIRSIIEELFTEWTTEPATAG